MENKPKQSKDKLCRRIRIGIGIFLIALGFLAVDGALGTVLIIIGILSLMSGIIWACPCSTMLGSTKAEKVCCLNPSANKKSGCWLNQNKGKNRCC